MVDQFVFNIPVRVLFGPGQLQKLHEQKLPGKKALIAISGGGSMKRHGHLDKVYAELDAAGVEYVLYEGIKPNPTTDSVDDGARMAVENNCDFVVALGGGSTMDAAKIIAKIATNGGACWDYSFTASSGGKKFTKPGLPLVCITTSAGTGSEVDVYSVITNEETQEKSALAGDYPVLSIVDCDLMMTVPPTFTAYQGMDAFFHAAETMVNIRGHYMSEAFALKVVELVAKYLPRAVADGSDKEARNALAVANTMAAYYMILTSEHTLEHAIGSFHDLPHGAGLIMISHAYFNLLAERECCEDKLIAMAKAMGHDDATCGKDFVAALDQLIADINCSDLKLGDYGVTREEMPAIVKKYHEVVGGNINSNPCKVTDDDILAILEASYK